MPQAGGADRGDRRGAVAPCLVGHAGDRVDGPRASAPAAAAALVEALAEPRDLGAVDDRPPGAVRARSPTWNLTEFVPTSMTA